MKHRTLGIAIALAAAVAMRPTLAAAADPLPADVAAKIVLKILLYDGRLAGHAPDIKVGVMGSDADVAAFGKLKGQKIDNAKPFTLVDVIKVDGLPPGSQPDILFVGTGGNAATVSGYTRGGKVMSATNDPSLVPAGISVGVGADGGKPKVILNLTSSEAEGIKWDPAVLKIAETVK